MDNYRTRSFDYTIYSNVYESINTKIKKIFFLESDVFVRFEHRERGKRLKVNNRKMNFNESLYCVENFTRSANECR